MYLNINPKYVNYDYLFENIPKFRCLKKLNFVNYVKDKTKLIELIKKVSKLPFLEKVKIEYFDKLSTKDINLIEKLISDVLVKESSISRYNEKTKTEIDLDVTKINKGYIDSEDEQPSDLETEERCGI